MLRDFYKRPLRTLRISVIDACNFRCTYCMPAEKYGHNYAFMSKKELLSFEEITRLVRIFSQLGVRKVKITGGEPLLRKDLCSLIAGIASIKEIEDISLTTNGYLLAQKALDLKNSGLHRVTISLDSLQIQNFQQLIGRKYNIEKVLEGIRAADNAQLYPIKINTVVIKGFNDDEIIDLVKYFRKKNYALRFIEYMDVGNVNGWKKDHVVSSREILLRIQKHYNLEAHGLDYGEVSDRYFHENELGEIHFISSVTKPFCSSCVRARISAEGKMYTCLFATKGFDLKHLLREKYSDEQIYNHISQLWKKRRDRYSEERSTVKKNSKIEMYYIGG